MVLHPQHSPKSKYRSPITIYSLTTPMEDVRIHDRDRDSGRPPPSTSRVEEKQGHPKSSASASILGSPSTKSGLIGIDEPGCDNLNSDTVARNTSQSLSGDNKKHNREVSYSIPTKTSQRAERSNAVGDRNFFWPKLSKASRFGETSQPLLL